MITLTREEAQKVLEALKRLHAKLSEPNQMTSSSIAQARAVAGLLRERNIQTWDDIDREAVFAIDALVSFASMLLNHRLSSVRTQPEPKPVAWLNKTKHGTWNADAFKCEGDEPSEPLYTAPPQREWVGLTDEEKTFIAWESNNGPHCVELTEAKLKEKNT